VIRLDGRVAIVTGAGRGLGRAHALALAARGARVLVNDLAGADGTAPNAESVAEEVRRAGGEALANGANVADWEQVQAMVRQATDAWGRVDIMVANAGILRDKSFLKMDMDDFRLVVDVHLMGSAHCARAAWEIMREQAYGRIVFTTSSTGLYGNFGQANYGAAKMAMVGLMNTLHLEGAKYDIRVNCLAPAAGTAMTEGLIPEAVYRLLSPESVSPGVVYLASEQAPSRVVLCAGGGSFAVYKGFETTGFNLAPEAVTPEGVAGAWADIADESGMLELQSGFKQTEKFAVQAAHKLGLDLSGGNSDA
jgi:NAD(P)-dependent dehydrogenase (short-subunit alcohol dehydrogenase family)